MCGLFGIINLDKRPVDLEECTRTLAILNHRGPDGSGYHHQEHVFLGHTRLSIIDVAGGAQPIYTEDGRFLVIFNGEIYNHEELRPALLAAGHRFKTRSDTEVLVHLFEDERERFLGKLNGMFAFAIFDTKTGSLFLARDRIGIKPLYYYCDGRQFIFSSEMKAIIKSGLVPVEVDDRVVYQFLTLHHSVPPDTLVKGIISLKPGHFLLVNGNPGEQLPYWDIESNVETSTLDPREVPRLVCRNAS
jgi:asparagine synthase (glutamine-hydrolysing)